MREDHFIAAVIPALNEAASIGQVLDEIPGWVDMVLVADNGSTDGTAAVAAEHGARVIDAPRRGYGAACLAGIAALDAPDIVVFLDADHSDHPEEMAALVDPIIDGGADLVIGSRVLGKHEPGALTPQARFGNWLATRLLRLFWGVSYTDLGPFRAIRYRTLLELGMADPDYGWTVEMQVKAALHGVPSREAPVSYRKRVGVSKISGTVRGVIGASYKILGTILVSALFARRVSRNQVFVLFTRYPEAGATKTRMIPALGPEGAAELQRAMTRHVLDNAPPPGVPVELRYAGGDTRRMRDWLGTAYRYAPQGGGDLGARMARACAEQFAQGVERVMLVGADCPEVDSGVTAAAFAALEKHDIVIGPAKDGGYYLIGLHARVGGDGAAHLFADTDWGTASVCECTEQRAAGRAWRVAKLATMRDVDVPDDLAVWGEAVRNARITVVLPTLNEAAHIEATLARAMDAENVGVIVVDGGSTDGTAALAEGLGARVLTAPRGRAVQMNAGAAAAEGGILLFLHADTLLPKYWAQHVRRNLALPGVALGAFRFTLDAAGWRYKYLEWTTRLRCRWVSMPYGDQGLFLRREEFEAVGGFPVMPVMEDYALVRTLKRRGKVLILDAPAITSVRRWERRGVFMTTLRNFTAFFVLPLGISPRRIARWLGRSTGE